ncbi:MAG: hypothetical protein K0R26_1951 [Bacteroidota bacterium]|nr:hypothetical protein [Bacteroidota bacterium]
MELGETERNYLGCYNRYKPLLIDILGLFGTIWDCITVRKLFQVGAHLHLSESPDTKVRRWTDWILERSFDICFYRTDIQKLNKFEKSSFKHSKNRFIVNNIFDYY